MKLDDIIKRLEKSSDSYDELDQLFPEKKFQYAEELVEKITDSLQQQDEDLLEHLILIANFDGVDKRYIDVFSKILVSEWDWLQEDVAMLLGEIADPSTSTILYETALNIPDHDDGRSLAKKCIWALRAICNQEANQKLKKLSTHPDPIISEHAHLQLL